MRFQVSVDAGTYTFDKVAKTVTISGLGTVSLTLDRIMAVIHAPSGALLYQLGNATVSAAAYTPVAGGGTLTFNAGVTTSGYNNADPLTVIVQSAATISPALPVAPSSPSTGAFSPAPAGANYPVAANGVSGALVRDVVGNLAVRGQITTDETSIRDDFPGSTLSSALTGTISFVNGSASITGTGTNFLTGLRHYDYIKLNADAESAWGQVQSITSDTAATLVASYTGAGGSGASSTSILAPTTGTGGTISVASSQVSVVSGTNATAATFISRNVDFGPLTVTFANVALSQRIAGQDCVLGFQSGTALTSSQYARFRFNGTAPDRVICESAYVKSGTPTANDIESTLVSIPGGSGAASVTPLRYRIEVLPNRVRFYINDIQVAVSSAHMPDNYDILLVVAGFYNSTPASSTTLTVDSIGVSNFDRLVVGSESQADLPAGGNTIPGDQDVCQPVRQAPADLFRSSFAQVGAGLVSSDFISLQQDAGTGASLNQAGGNLVMTSSTFAGGETLLRSARSFRGAYNLRARVTLSQRIANNQFVIELADLIGSSLAFTVNSATSVTITIPNNPFTALNVGQSLNIGACSNLAATLAGRYAIASVTATTITLTVAGWPASGTGTCTLYGWNYARVLYDLVTATNAKFDTQRNGWATGDSVITINTTASPGHLSQIQSDGTLVAVYDSLAATATTYLFAQRGTRLENLPDDSTVMYLWIRSTNTAAPATNTTFTVGFVGVELQGNNRVWISGVTQTGASQALTVNPSGTQTVSAANLSCNVAQVGGTATVTGGVAGILAMGGNIANGVAPTANPVPLARDSGGLTRFLTLTDGGGITGPGEVTHTFAAFTAGSATPAEGTNSRTYLAPRSVDCDLYLGCVAQGNGANTIQVEGSWDNVTFQVIPLSRIDNLATAQQYAFQGAFTPTTAATYKGRSYGYGFIRVHQTAFTTTGTNGLLRLVPITPVPGQQLSAFTLDAVNTTEAAGTANGALMAGGVRTLAIQTRGAAKVILDLDAFTYATAAPTSSSVVLEGLQGGAWSALSIQPVQGGAAITAISTLGALNQWVSGQWEADATGLQGVRVRWSANVAGTATAQRYHGCLRVVPVASSGGQKATYVVSILGAAPTSAAYALAIVEAGAAKAVKLKSITWNNIGSATAAQRTTFSLTRETTASSVGTVATPTVRDPGDTAFTGVARTGNPTPGTNAVTLEQWSFFTPTTVGAFQPFTWLAAPDGVTKPYVIPAGTANGLVLKCDNGAAGYANLDLVLVFTEE